MVVPPQDRFFLMGEGRTPAPVGMIGFAVEGEVLNRARLVGALEQAIARHPKATSQLVHEPGPLGGRLFWDPVSGMAEKVCRFHRSDEFPKDLEAIEEVFTQLLNEALHVTVGPALELHAYPSDGKSGFLVARYHHALGDGYGLLQFLGDLIAAYNGEPIATASPAASDASPERGTAKGRLDLIATLLAFYWRRGRATRFAPPEKLYDTSRDPGEHVAVAFRRVEPERTARLRRAARAHGARFNDLLLAAWGLGIEAWKRERGQPCGTLRIMVNHGQRQIHEGSFENLSSAFPVWLRPADRSDRKTLLHNISGQARECIEGRIPEAIGLFAGLMRLPLGLARRLLEGAFRPENSDSLIVSNLGALPASSAGGMQLGDGRLVGVYIAIRATRGSGALHTCGSTDDLMVLGLNYRTGVLERPEVERLLDLVEAELDAFAEDAD